MGGIRLSTDWDGKNGVTVCPGDTTAVSVGVSVDDAGLALQPAAKKYTRMMNIVDNEFRRHSF